MKPEKFSKLVSQAEAIELWNSLALEHGATGLVPRFAEHLETLLLERVFPNPLDSVGQKPKPTNTTNRPSFLRIVK